MSSRLKRPTVALVSEHASPLAVLGGVDAGGQNVHVAALAEHLARRGLASRRVHTTRRPGTSPRRVRLCTGVSVVHVDAGPPMPMPKDELLPYMSTFADVAASHSGQQIRPTSSTPTSGCPAAPRCAAGRRLGLPVVQTFHALGVVKRRQQGAEDTSPPGRLATEARARAHGRPRHRHVHATRCSSSSGSVAIGHACPSCRAASTSALHARRQPSSAAGLARRLVVVSRLVERKGIGNVIAALAEVPDTELVIAGGPQRTQLADDPEARRLLQLAREHGVADRVELRGQLRRARAAAAAAIGRRRRVRAVVRAVRHRAARGDGLRSTGRRQRGRRAHRHRRRRRDRRARPASRRRTGWRTPCAPLLGDPAAAERHGPRAVRLRVEERYGWERVADATLACYARCWRVTTPAVRRGERMSESVARLAELRAALERLEDDVERIERWGVPDRAAPRRRRAPAGRRQRRQRGPGRPPHRRARRPLRR